MNTNCTIFSADENSDYQDLIFQQQKSVTARIQVTELFKRKIKRNSFKDISHKNLQKAKDKFVTTSGYIKRRRKTAS